MGVEFWLPLLSPLSVLLALAIGRALISRLVGA